MTAHEKKLVRQRRGETFISRESHRNGIYLRGGARVGGHIAHPPLTAGSAWTDCSGAAFYVAQVMDLPVLEIIAASHEPIWTGSLVKMGIEGESDYFTMFIKDPYEAEGEGHVIMRLRKRPHHRTGEPEYRWAECGGFDNPEAGGGLHWFKPTPERIAEFPYRRCFKGF